MDLDKAEHLARELMGAHGLGSWGFYFDRASRRFGACHFHTRSISLSRRLVGLNSEDAVTNVILHEIAHGLAGAKAGHGARWREIAVSIGCDAKRLYDSQEIVVPAKRFVGTCPNCGVEVRVDRRKRSACAACCKAHNNGRFSAAFLFVWARNVT